MIGKIVPVMCGLMALFNGHLDAQTTTGNNSSLSLPTPPRTMASMAVPATGGADATFQGNINPQTQATNNLDLPWTFASNIGLGGQSFVSTNPQTDVQYTQSIGIYFSNDGSYQIYRAVQGNIQAFLKSGRWMTSGSAAQYVIASTVTVTSRSCASCTLIGTLHSSETETVSSGSTGSQSMGVDRGFPYSALNGHVGMYLENDVTYQPGQASAQTLTVDLAFTVTNTVTRVSTSDTVTLTNVTGG